MDVSTSVNMSKTSKIVGVIAVGNAYTFKILVLNVSICIHPVFGLYCIVLIRFYSASLSMSHSEALPTPVSILCRSYHAEALQLKRCQGSLKWRTIDNMFSKWWSTVLKVSEENVVGFLTDAFLAYNFNFHLRHRNRFRGVRLWY